jgi:hypothetical protein
MEIKESIIKAYHDSLRLEDEKIKTKVDISYSFKNQLECTKL